MNVSVIEHVKKVSDLNGTSINLVDPYISFFAWHALQPISADVLRFMQGYLAGNIPESVSSYRSLGSGLAITHTA
jgi:hypothetical protein